MGEYLSRIKDWPSTERPRERLVQHGPHILSDSELLGIILRTGDRKKSAMDLARHLLQKYGGLRGLDTQPAEVLCNEYGIGPAKAAQIKAALELAKRLVQQQWSSKEKLNTSEDAYHYMRLRMRDLSREEFRALFLTSANEIIADKILFEGSLRESVVSPREIILTALQLTAAAVILLHNHPSGNPTPSREDKLVTDKIVKACRYADIQVLDHIVIGRDDYFSFADEGIL
ncbi:DNA repair protein RadC [candidate division KSB1 bacterium]|nr:DNA repair protein RadC [candidate division KSB1 bacterium]